MVQTIVDQRTKQDIPLDQLNDIVKKMIEEQANKLFNDADNYGVKDEFQAAYKKETDNIMKVIFEAAANSMSIEILKNILEKGYEEIQNTPEVAGNKDFGSYMGTFIEKEYFGMPKGNSPLSDFKSIGADIKSHSGDGIQQVGDIMIKNILYEQTVSQRDYANIAIFKMAIKMASFLYFKVEREIQGGKIRVHYPEITLYTFLILEKLKKMIDKMLEDNIDSMVTLNKTSWSNNNRIFSVKLRMDKFNDVYIFAQLYLYRYDLLKEIKVDNAFRKGFFGAIHDMKAFKDLGQPFPQITITPE
jgi:hypothetical protein